MPARNPVAGNGEAESIGELSRMLQAFKADTHDDLVALNARIAQLSFITPELYAGDRHADGERHKADIARMERIEHDLLGKADAAALDAIKADVARIKGNNQWIWRTVGSAFVLAAIGILVAASGFPH